MESLPFMITFLVLGGLVLPLAAMYIGFISAAARIVYTVTYVNWGSNSRVIGVIAGSLPIYLLGIADLVQLIRFASIAA